MDYIEAKPKNNYGNETTVTVGQMRDLLKGHKRSDIVVLDPSVWSFLSPNSYGDEAAECDVEAITIYVEKADG